MSRFSYRFDQINRMRTLKSSYKQLRLEDLLIFENDSKKRPDLMLSFVTNDGTCNVSVSKHLAREIGHRLLETLKTRRSATIDCSDDATADARKSRPARKGLVRKRL